MARPPFDHPWVDETRSPLYLCKIPDPLPQDEYEAYIAHLDEWVKNVDEPYGWIIYPDLKTSKQRAQMAESQARRSQYEKLHCSCYGFVVTDPIVRGVITAVLWLNSPAVITKVFYSEPDAWVLVTGEHARFLQRLKDRSASQAK